MTTDVDPIVPLTELFARRADQARCAVTGFAPKGLVPPRPNLGPEPWPGEAPIAPYLLAAGAALALLACGLILWRLRRRRRRTALTSLPVANPADDSPREQIVALSAALRAALTNQFGTAWRAKTTEELSADSRLKELLGVDQLEEFSRFLDYVDHLKFAPERTNNNDGAALEANLATWAPRVESFRSKIQASR